MKQFLSPAARELNEVNEAVVNIMEDKKYLPHEIEMMGAERNDDSNSGFSIDLGRQSSIESAQAKARPLINKIKSILNSKHIKYEMVAYYYDEDLKKHLIGINLE